MTSRQCPPFCSDVYTACTIHNHGHNEQLTELAQSRIVEQQQRESALISPVAMPVLSCTPILYKSRTPRLHFVADTDLLRVAFFLLMRLFTRDFPGMVEDTTWQPVGKTQQGSRQQLLRYFFFFNQSYYNHSSARLG